MKSAIKPEECLRVLCKNYLVVTEKGASLFTKSKEKAIEHMEECKTKNLKCYLQEIPGSIERVKEIGKNIFARKLTLEQHQNLIEYRNTIIKHWMKLVDEKNYNESYAWIKTCKEFQLGDITVDEFNQWMLDVHNYNPYANKKFDEIQDNEDD